MNDQTHRRSEPVKKLHLGGIKFSEAQARMVFYPTAGCADLTPISRSFAKHRINLQQFSFSRNAAGVVELYFSEQDYQRYRGLIYTELESFGLEPAVVSSVGTLTLFPHGSSMDVLLKVMNAAARVDMNIYGVCSSLSAFSIATDADRLDQAAKVLLEDFSLPDDHSPFRYEPSELDLQLTGGQGRIVETVAKYWEPVIRIYGANLKTGLSGFTVSFAVGQLARVTDYLADSGCQRFEMMGLWRTEPDRYHLHLMIDPGQDGIYATSLTHRFADAQEIDISVQHGLELLFLHGPHFQDRYGVVHTAVSALTDAELDCSRVSCAGTGVHLVADEGVGGRMLEVLGKVFVVP